MSWTIGKPRALLEALAPRLVAWARGRARDAEVAPAEPIAERVEVEHAEAVPETRSEKPAPATSDALKLSPEVEKPLLEAGMPPEGSSIYNGLKRAADTPEGAARKFVLWARAVGATGTYSTRTISALYWECAEVDHREPVAIDRFLRALKGTRGVRQDASPTDGRRRVWIIEPAAEPKRVPKAQAAVTAKVLARMPQISAQVLQRFAPEQDYSSPQLLRASAHDARRQGRARKQRGSRNARWAA
jgi:hypothetical protein